MKKKFKNIIIILASILIIIAALYLYLMNSISRIPVVTPVSPNAIKTASTTNQSSTSSIVQFQTSTDPVMTDAERKILNVPKTANVRVLRRDIDGNVYDYQVIK